MEPYTAQLYLSPIALPERSVGNVSIQHMKIKKGAPLDVVGFRQALLRGCAPLKTVAPRDMIIHQLCDKKRGVWMTDLPEELNQIYEAIYYLQPFGNVFVGGLGLGLLPKILTKHPDVFSVTVVERDARIIKLSQDSGAQRVIHDDLYSYLITSPRFNSYMLDTWQGTSEGTYWSEVLPARRLIGNKHMGFVTPKVWCWAEDIMRGQCIRSILNPRVRYWYYSIFPKKMSGADCMWFFNNVGSAVWEKKYGEKLDEYNKTRKS